MKKNHDFSAGRSVPYAAPSVEMIEISIEKGFADSDMYGEPGAPGGDLGGGNDYDL